jgi:hypothetical protein
MNHHLRALWVSYADIPGMLSLDQQFIRQRAPSFLASVRLSSSTDPAEASISERRSLAANK